MTSVIIIIQHRIDNVENEMAYLAKRILHSGSKSMRFKKGKLQTLTKELSFLKELLIKINELGNYQG
jgi:hypothetical protein